MFKAELSPHQRLSIHNLYYATHDFDIEYMYTQIYYIPKGMLFLPRRHVSHVRYLLVD